MLATDDLRYEMDAPLFEAEQDAILDAALTWYAAAERATSPADAAFCRREADRLYDRLFASPLALNWPPVYVLAAECGEAAWCDAMVRLVGGVRL